MKIKNLDGLTMSELQTEVNSGAKFVIYTYAVSIIFMTFKRPSNIYFIRSTENAVGRGLGFSFISFIAGWWGIPWGPVYTIGSFVNNFGGGKNVTQEVMNSLISQNLFAEAN
jgi:hypothetical protein